jgi:hypothetical protein
VYDFRPAIEERFSFLFDFGFAEIDGCLLHFAAQMVVLGSIGAIPLILVSYRAWVACSSAFLLVAFCLFALDRF